MVQLPQARLSLPYSSSSLKSSQVLSEGTTGLVQNSVSQSPSPPIPQLPRGKVGVKIHRSPTPVVLRPKSQGIAGVGGGRWGGICSLQKLQAKGLYGEAGFSSTEASTSTISNMSGEAPTSASSQIPPVRQEAGAERS